MDVAEKPPALAPAGEPLDGRLAAGLFQGENGPGLLGEIEQHGRRFQGAAGRAPGQGLVGEHLAPAQGDDGLVHGADAAKLQNLPELAQHGRDVASALAGQPGGLGQGPGQGLVKPGHALADDLGGGGPDVRFLPREPDRLGPQPAPGFQTQGGAGPVHAFQGADVASGQDQDPARFQPFHQAHGQSGQTLVHHPAQLAFHGIGQGAGHLRPENPAQQEKIVDFKKHDAKRPAQAHMTGHLDPAMSPEEFGKQPPLPHAAFRNETLLETRCELHNGP